MVILLNAYPAGNGIISIVHLYQTKCFYQKCINGLVFLVQHRYQIPVFIYPRAQASRVIGERAKRARCYLVMFMETRDIYMYICRSVSNTHARVSVLRIKFKSKETEDFLACAVKYQ